MSTLNEFTTEELEAEIVRRKQAATSQASALLTESIQGFIDENPTLVDLGILALADDADETWVRLKIPFASESGYKKALMLGFAGELVSTYGGKATEDPTEIRVRADRAISHLQKIVSLATQ